MADSNNVNILLIYTGGTIGMIRDADTQSLRAFDFDNLLQHIPEIKHIGCNIKTLSIAQPYDSSNVHPSNWTTIAQLVNEHYHCVDGFVVLHGSDTMAYTASALSFMLENLEKPVIITGSQLPVGDLRTDAKENLITSIQLASLQENNQALIREVAIYFEYKLYRGNRATKISTDNFEAFYSGNFPPLAESGVRLNVFNERLWRNPTGNPFKIHTKMSSNLLFVSLYPGISLDTLTHMFDLPGIKLIILETFGAGNAPTDATFLNLIQEKINQGILFINLTQCLVGRVEMGLYETSSSLKSMGVISAADMTRESCITKSMYLLGQEVNNSIFEQMFTTSIRGELT